MRRPTKMQYKPQPAPQTFDDCPAECDEAGLEFEEGRYNKS